MSDRPSAPLLEVLRNLVKKKGLTSQSVADSSGLDRKRVRRLLAGKEPMLVDELLVLGNALDLSPEDLALPMPAGEEAKALGLADVERDEPEDDRVDLDMWGNHPEQLVRTGFRIACDFMCIFAADLLEDSGVPKHVLRQYAGKDLPLKFDAAYHPYNNPRFTDGAFTVSLSFDAVYDCTIPYQAVKQIIFFPSFEEPEPEEEEEEEKPKGPVLRLVT